MFPVVPDVQITTFTVNAGFGNNFLLKPVWVLYQLQLIVTGITNLNFSVPILFNGATLDSNQYTGPNTANFNARNSIMFCRAWINQPPVPMYGFEANAIFIDNTTGAGISVILWYRLK